MSIQDFLSLLAKAWIACTIVYLVLWFALRILGLLRRDTSFASSDPRTWTLPVFLTQASLVALIVAAFIELLGTEVAALAVVVAVVASPGLTALGSRRGR